MSSKKKSSISVTTDNNNNNNNTMFSPEQMHQLSQMMQQMMNTQIKQEVTTSTPTMSSSYTNTAHTNSSTLSSSHTLKIVVLTGITKLSTTVNATSFRTFRDSFTTYVQLHSLSMYLTNTYEEVCKKMVNLYSTTSTYAIQLHVQQQSESMSAALRLALGIHWNAIADKVAAVATDSTNVDKFIIDNIYVVWSEVLKQYETYSQFHTISWLRSLIHIKHNSQDDPAKTLERFMVINRQLIQAGTKLPENVLAAYLIDSMPADMSSIQQHLCTINADTTDKVYQAMKLFYDSKITKLGANKSNQNNSDIEKALAFSNTGQCFHFIKHGSCMRGDSCKYSHDSNGKSNSKSKSKSQSKYQSKQKSKSNKSGTDHSTATTSDDGVVGIHTFNDCLDDYGNIDMKITEHSAVIQPGLHKLHIDRPNEVILDSGASRNTCCTKRLLKDMERVNPIPMLGISNKVMFVSEVGTMKLNSKIEFYNSIYVPNASTNLVSVSRLYDAGLNIKWSKTQAIVSFKGNELIVFKRIGGVYVYTIPGRLADIDDDTDESDTPGVGINKLPSPGHIPRKGAVRFTPSTSSSSTSSASTAISPSSSSSTTTSPSTAARNILATARGKVTTNGNSPGTGSTVVAHAKCLFDISKLDLSLVNCSNVEQVYSHVSADTIHARFGHYGQHENCETCILSKGRRTKIGRSNTRIPAVAVYDRLHMDLVGPISTVIDGDRISAPSIGGHKYSLTTVDEKSNYIHTSLLHHKSEATNEIIKLISTISTQHNHLIKGIHSDRGGEFINGTLKTYCDDNGIIHTTSTAYKPQHNGLAERMNGIICNTARAMLVHAKSHISLWGEALATAVYVHNRTSLPQLDGKSPYELVHSIKPNTDHLRIWGCDSWVMLQTHQRGKFDKLQQPGMFVGYSEDQNAYRIMLSDGSIRVSRDVHFNEHTFRFMVIYHTHINGNTSGLLDEPYNHDIFDSTSTTHNSNVEVDTNFQSTDNTLQLHSLSHPNSVEVDSTDVSTTHIQQSKENNKSGVQLATVPTVPDERYNLTIDDNENKYHYNEIDISFDISYDQQEEQYDSDCGNDHTSSVEENNIKSVTTDVKTNNNDDAFITAEELQPTITRTRSNRISNPVSRLGFSNPNDYLASDRKQLEHLLMFEDLSMLSYKQAMNRTDANKWSSAMGIEINSLLVQKVGTEVDITTLPPDTKPITCRWLFKIKYDDTNQPIQHKARLVVHGHKQIYGIDFTETFAPVAKSKSIKLILADAAINNKELKQFDVETAFLNAKLTETVYIKLPDGCGKLSGKIWKLNKALYGLKQAPHEWNSEIHDTLTNILGYTVTKADPCIYRKNIDNHIITIYLYVDDTIISYDSSIESSWLKDFNIIKSKYKIKDLGNCDWILNMKVVRDRITGTITLSQQAYIQQLLSEHQMDTGTVRTVDNPCDQSLTTITHTSDLLDSHQHSKFRSIIGGLSYAANMTRIDIAYAVSVLSRQLAAPTQLHLIAAKRILRYLAGTSHYAMIFKTHHEQSNYPIVAYTDASHANDLIDRKSTTGTVIKFYGNTICWQSKKQKCVALSSTDAEYYAMSETVCEALWVRQWLYEVYNIQQPILVLCDNQSAIHWSAHDSTHQRTKHIDTRYHFIRDHTKQNTIIVKWLQTNKQEADILTKCMITKQFNYLVSKNLYW
jgi:hypothetical protein